MTNRSTLASALSLSGPPVAVGFLEAPPPGVAKWQRNPVPAGCTFWRYAMEGQTFYTEPSDHWNCAVGAHTHGITLPVEHGPVLQDTVGFMVSSGYIELSEVPSIPVLPAAPRYIAYGPADAVPFSPDLFLIAAKPASAMLIYEAAVRCGATSATAPALGRPACAVLPLARNQNASAVSFGCKGNRTFTGLPDEELYICIPGEKWNALLAELALIRDANRKMEEHYIQQRSLFPILN